MSHDSNNIMVILSSPSGAGKTTITKKIQQKYQTFKISVSHTTRKPRPNEVDGVDYYFVSQEKFKKFINEGKFYEYAKIFDNYYGTSKESVDQTIKTNDIIFDIDWQGTQQLSKFKSLKLIKIFLIPPNKKELKQRLIKRNQDSPKEVERRFKAYDKDIQHWQDYDYIIINENLENNVVNNNVDGSKILLESKTLTETSISNETSAIANERIPKEEMVLKSSGNSWVEIEDLDGNSYLTRLMRSGETFVVPDKKGLTLSTGNAGVLSLTFGSTHISKLGSVGEVISSRPLNIEAFKKR